MKILALLLVALCARAETLDRIAVTVGRHVISEHDIFEDMRISAFIDGKAPVFSAELKRKAAERLVDQYLVLEDATATRVPPPPAADVAGLLTPIKARYVTDQAYRAALAQAQISEAELAEQLLAGLRMLRYTDLRFRPEVQLSDETLRAYYNKVKPPQSFEASRGDIEKLLTDQQTMQALDLWLDMSRGETVIVYHEGAFK
ncbi:MAG: hypothetical protein M3N41_04650 [Acidobacteriota bacterium]|nr:hypothetical protein [Acidobacteriota bacterium]